MCSSNIIKLTHDYRSYTKKNEEKANSTLISKYWSPSPQMRENRNVITCALQTHKHTHLLLCSVVMPQHVFIAKHT